MSTLSPTAIGMLHIPINSILSAPRGWRERLGLPTASADDWRLMQGLADSMPNAVDPSLCGADQKCLKEVKRLTFYAFLEERMLEEAAIYQRHQFNSLMLENIAAPYFVRGQQHPVLYWIMLALAEKMKETYPSLQLGIQILACSDDWAMQIACRCGLDFLRSESALFEGVRPEGRTANLGNLAGIYMTRNMHLAALAEGQAGPQVYVDVEKKHTVFMAGLNSLDVWLENILFQKLEGVIVTGRATGSPVAETDLQQAREAIEKVKEQSRAAVGSASTPLLIVGSGVSTRNAAMCKRYADAVIVGSSLKREGYWECALDEERVQSFAQTWHRTG